MLQSEHPGPAVLVSLSSVHLSWISPDIVHLAQADLSYVLEEVMRHNVIKPGSRGLLLRLLRGSKSAGWMAGGAGGGAVSVPLG